MSEIEHAHHGGHAEAEADRANVGVIGILFASTAIIMAVISYMLWVYFQREAEAINYAQVLSQPSPQLEALRQTEADLLEGYGVTDREKGYYRIPVEQGASLFLKEAAARRNAGRPQVVRPAATAETEGTGSAPADQAEGDAGAQ